MKIGDRVKRNTTERGYQGEGEIVEIDQSQGRARVKWEDKRTWYKLDRLMLVDSSKQPKPLTEDQKDRVLAEFKAYQESTKTR